tara:strand:- start:1744 stop:2262 length:519 start_codon:yes stop_codon:yes gene_type:complete
MPKLGLIPLESLLRIMPKSDSGFTLCNLYGSAIVATGYVSQIYPVLFCTTWGIFVSFNSAPFLDPTAFRQLATLLKMESLLIFHIMYNGIAHGIPCILVCAFPPNNMHWFSGLIAASVHLIWGATVSRGTMLLDKVYVPMPPKFWKIMWISAIVTELGTPFFIYPIIKRLIK